MFSFAGPIGILLILERKEEQAMGDFTKRERVECILSGKLADRPPVTAYRHFPNVERKPEDLAGIMLDWQNKYDWDLVKIHPTAVYMQEVYGDQFDYDHYVEEIFPPRLAAPPPRISWRSSPERTWMSRFFEIWWSLWRLSGRG